MRTYFKSSTKRANDSLPGNLLRRDSHRTFDDEQVEANEKPACEACAESSSGPTGNPPDHGAVVSITPRDDYARQLCASQQRHGADSGGCEDLGRSRGSCC